MTTTDLYLVAYLVAGPVTTDALAAHLAAEAAHATAVNATETAQQTATATLAAKVRRALDWDYTGILDGDTATRINVWSQHELNTVYERVGGVVTTRNVRRASSDGSFPAIEITVTVNLPRIGTVQIVTDWDEDSGGHDLPVMRAITSLAAA